MGKTLSNKEQISAVMSLLGKRRWEGVSKEDRSAHMSRMGKKGWPQDEVERAERVRKMLNGKRKKSIE